MTPRSATRHAIILAAGTGTRLRPHTLDRPKPLVEVNGTPILVNALENLAAIGIEEITIIVGYRKDAIKAALGDRFKTLLIRYVEAPDYATTGSAWSLWLSADVLAKENLFLLEADVFFEQALLSRLAAHPAESVAAVARFDSCMQGSAVTIDETDRINDVRTGLKASDIDPVSPCFYKTINIYRLSREMAGEKLLPLLRSAAASDERGLFVEQLLERLARRGQLGLVAVHCDDLKWVEIDSADDLDMATVIFADPSTLEPR
ncbi:phosphocholine cytidylyltransferase family protein [Agrobacterium rhizogenes]|uniref:phosphocholine cytidylyltransferase family protein n=1 Tax=Rhizobium rhizogenes TaxID=359 RepID=UPI0022B63DC1|nr:phosphocholine cytidylyltransferase family protein [Rhizobium rhizogenes]MCZ7450274.1 phosphocholine cytidylyltransferase family protein [Rhizobium rhizogenes]